jgi:ribosome-binding factor A
MSIRAQQVGSAVMRALGPALAELNDPRLEGVLVSVTRVMVNPDLHEATVFVSVTPAGHGKRVLAALGHARGWLQSRVGDAVRMRTLPRLHFRIDDSLKRQDVIFDAIQEGLASDARPGKQPPDGDGVDAEAPTPRQEPRR